MEGARTWSTITSNQVRSSALAFYQGDPECGMVVPIDRAESPW
jgi:hypothetical protein